MSDTSGRLLRLLSLLQSPREWPGGELAAQLRVSLRTVRRDVERLRDLGYPVRATMGPVGGYRLVAGKALPPLLLDDEEAVAIAVGLRVAAVQAVAGIDDASVRALAKLEQVLPSRLRARVGSLRAATVPLPVQDAPAVDPDTLTVLATAAANRERVRFGYRSVDGTDSVRLVEPYRLVPAGRRWYLVGYDVDREDWRNFRVDRVGEPRPTGVRTAPREPPGGDAAAFLTGRLYSLAPTYTAVATLHAPLRDMAARLGGAAADLEPVDDRSCRLRSHADTLEWLAVRLTTLGCEFEVHEPPELAEYLHALAARVTRAAGGTSGSVGSGVCDAGAARAAVGGSSG
ncbi:MAG TPA: YafY family protein [Rugosimonospora sp.]|jgi:predicted DNA-binding transcriptional regulator YafY